MLKFISKWFSKQYVEEVLHTTIEDIIQVFSIKAFDALKWFKPGKHPFLGFWARFMVNALKDIARNSKLQKRLGQTVTIDDEEQPIHLVSDKNAERLVINRLWLHELFSLLSEKERTVVIRRFNNYTFPEIAEQMGFSRSHPRKIYLQALEKMRGA
ncbi:hypothetical protein CUU64_07655 [Bacillus sp. V5-8f]|nr:hypothetical protein CUU64_07655 [Bacillus sp. V5-8f]